jgi:hypothetical protein
LIFSSDKTQLSVLSGNKKAWPVYLSIGNISKSVRRRPSQRAMLLVGYIPVTDLRCIKGKEARKRKSWELFHACMAEITAPLRAASTRGEEMVCADGSVRRVYPILAAYVADFPEQCLVACTSNSRCPICTVPLKERGAYGPDPPLRTKHDILSAFNLQKRGYLTRMKKLGFRPTRPFWANLPFVNGSACITPDLLHQLHKGVFKSHLVKWCAELLGEEEVDRRLAGMTRHEGIRHFGNGISKLSQWTGNESKAVMKVYLSALAGTGHSEAVGVARSLIDFMYRSHLPQMDEGDLAELEASLAEFHDYKDIFRSTGVLATLRLFNDIPKIHMLRHYAYFIRELGTTDGYNTEVPERLHIDYVKVGYRASNKVNPTQQMAKHLQRREAWAMLRALLEELGVVPKRKVGARNQMIDLDFDVVEGDVDVDEDEVEVEQEQEGQRDGEGQGEGRAGGEDGEDEDQDEDEGEAEVLGPRGRGGHEETYHPMPAIKIAKRPPRRMRACDLIDTQSAPDLLRAVSQFLSPLLPFDPSRLIDGNSIFPVWTRCSLLHDPLPFAPLLGPKVDKLRAFPASHDDDDRVKRQESFDTVLVDLKNRLNGVHREFPPYFVYHFPNCERTQDTELDVSARSSSHFV